MIEAAGTANPAEIINKISFANSPFAYPSET